MTSSIESGIFWILAVFLVGLSVYVVSARSVFRGALALTGALGVVAALFALLGADFVAAGQLLVYVGGIMIIMLFVIMLSQQPSGALDRQTNNQWLFGGVLALIVASGLLLEFRAVYGGIALLGAPQPTTQAIGRLLLGEMVVPFEVISLILLAALVGAVYFAKGHEWKP
jgi:NADH:ubiquinone oxidoreductase subunit 6 (subunit J)